MSDYFSRRDLGSVVSYSDPLSLFDFLFESPEQLVFNDSNQPIRISFDGVNDHGRLQGSGPSKVIEWSDHLRRRLWVRRESAGGGSLMVEIYASTR